MAQLGLSMEPDAKKGMPGRTPTPLSGTPAGPSPVSAKMRAATGLTPAKPASAKRATPRPINMPGGPALPLPNVPHAPTVPTGVRPVSGPQPTEAHARRRASAQYIICSRCSMPISVEGIKQGESQLLNGVPTCKTCLRKAAERQRAARAVKLGLIAAGCAALACAIFFPAHMLFVGVIAAVLAAICGVLGFTLNTGTRTTLVAGGIVAAAVGIFVLGSMSDQKEAQTATSDLTEEARAVQALIEKDQVADAEQRLNALAARADNGKGGYVSGSAQTLVEQTRASLNEHLRAKHGEIGGREREVLNFLASAYPDKPGGSARFRELKVDNSTLKMSVLLNEEPLNGCIMDELKDLPFAIFEIFPKIERIEARCISAGGGEAGAISLDRDKAAAIRARMSPTSGLPIQAQALKAAEKPAPGAIPEHKLQPESVR